MESSSIYQVIKISKPKAGKLNAAANMSQGLNMEAARMNQSSSYY